MALVSDAGNLWALVDTKPNTPSVVVSTIRGCPQQTLAASIRDPFLGMYSGYVRFKPGQTAGGERLGSLKQLKENGYDIRKVSIHVEPLKGESA